LSTPVLHLLAGSNGAGKSTLAELVLIPGLHVVMIPEELAVARVVDRVAAGGHAVPEDKVRARYARLWELVARARAIADRADFYDTSSLDEPFRRVAVYEYGQPVGRASWPSWTPAALT
jgi:predicted ABC-type ATPase